MQIKKSSLDERQGYIDSRTHPPMQKGSEIIGVGNGQTESEREVHPELGIDMDHCLVVVDGLRDASVGQSLGKTAQ